MFIHWGKLGNFEQKFLWQSYYSTYLWHHLLGKVIIDFWPFVFFFRGTSAEVKIYSQNANEAAQDLLNSNQAEILDQMD